MKILLLGSGGREHALAWKITQSSQLTRLYVVPGNTAISEKAECIAIESTDIPSLLSFAKVQKIDLVVVGPEAPLVAGLGDAFMHEGIAVFGPVAAAARLEASKDYTKQLCRRKRIPTASFQSFSVTAEAKAYAKQQKFPLVVKADGLASGKGVFICQQFGEASAAIEEILDKKNLGSHQSKVILEDFLSGEEASFMGVADGSTFLPLATSQDHKRLYDHDEGPNTGGMGAYSPAPVVSPKIYEQTLTQVIRPTLEGLQEEGVRYRGVLYAGLMIDREKTYLLEYNVRLGDPECQAIIPRLESDFIGLMSATCDGTLEKYSLKWKEQSSVCVVLATEGYPSTFIKGAVIEGLEDAARLPGIHLFHAGTERKEGHWVVKGGRVLGVTALGDTLEEAITRAYAAVQKIHWKGMHYRKDIGVKGLEKGVDVNI